MMRWNQAEIHVQICWMKSSPLQIFNELSCSFGLKCFAHIDLAGRVFAFFY